MNTTIWKYELRIEDEQVIRLPRNAVVLSVGLQSGLFVLWACVNPDQVTKDRIFYVRGTGHPLTGAERRHVGTVQMPNGLVWHVFEA